MFFSASHTLAGGGGVAEIGRASSPDGPHFTAEPAPVLSSDLTGEAVLLAPRVIVDGSVFKMFYSYARAQDIMDLQNLCNSNNKIHIGYATSTDGFYWIRSPSNPAVEVGGAGWDATSNALLAGVGRAARRQVDELGVRALLHDLPDGLGPQRLRAERHWSRHAPLSARICDRTGVRWSPCWIARASSGWCARRSPSSATSARARSTTVTPACCCRPIAAPTCRRSTPTPWRRCCARRRRASAWAAPARATSTNTLLRFRADHAAAKDAVRLRGRREAGRAARPRRADDARAPTSASSSSGPTPGARSATRASRRSPRSAPRARRCRCATATACRRPRSTRTSRPSTARSRRRWRRAAFASARRCSCGARA